MGAGRGEKKQEKALIIRGTKRVRYRSIFMQIARPGRKREYKAAASHNLFDLKLPIDLSPILPFFLKCRLFFLSLSPHSFYKLTKRPTVSPISFYFQSSFFFIVSAPEMFVCGGAVTDRSLSTRWDRTDKRFKMKKKKKRSNKITRLFFFLLFLLPPPPTCVVQEFKECNLSHVERLNTGSKRVDFLFLQT